MDLPGRFAALAMTLVALATAGPALADGAAPVAPCAPCAAPPVRDPCDPCFDGRRGPPELRDPFLVAQPRLMLPATTPDTLGCGRTEVKIGFSWANSFGFRQDVAGENPGRRDFLVDGEAITVDATFLRGVTRDLDLGVRLPVQWRGGGVMDDFIDWWHDWSSFVTLDNDRPEFDTNEYRVEGTRKDGSPFDWDESGFGLGNVEGIARWRFLDGGRDRPSLALVGRVTLPTGTGPFRVGGVEAGAQVVAAQRLLRTVDLYAGVGGTWFSEDTVDGLEYEPWRVAAFAALEWRPWRAWSFFLETDAASRLVTNVPNYPSQQWYLNAGVKWEMRPGTTLEVGFVENIESQQTTADTGLYLAIGRRW